MLHFPVEPVSAYVPLGVLYVLVALTLWTTLLRQSDALSTGLWCGGAMLGGVGFAGLGIVGWQGDKHWLLVSSALIIASYVFRINALRRDKKMQLGWLYEMSFVGLVIMAHFLLSDYTIEGEWIFLVVHVFVTGLLAYEAMDTWRRFAYKNAAYIAVAYYILAALSLVRLLVLWSLHGLYGNTDNSISYVLDAVTLVGIIVASLYGSYGYLGLVLEKVHQEYIRQCKATYNEHLQAEIERSKRTHAEALLAEKNQLTNMLADEVRNPISQAVPRVRQVQSYFLQKERLLDVTDLEIMQLKKAVRLLMSAIKSIDNYLMADALINKKRTAVKREISIDSLIEISMADVWDEDRRRIDLIRQYASKTTYLDVNLVSFAISNVVAYASRHSLINENIELLISEVDELPLIIVKVLFNSSQDLNLQCVEGGTS